MPFNLGLVAIDHFDERQQEGGGLAGSGLRAGNQVAAFQCRGNGLLLDRGGGADAHGIEAVQ
jgi:hypothetical protein